MPDFEPQFAQFVWQWFQHSNDIDDEMAWPEEIHQYRSWPRRFFYKNCLPMEKVTTFFERELKERTEATERLQYDLMEKPLMLRLEDSNVVNIALDYISPMNLPNCLVAK